MVSVLLCCIACCADQPGETPEAHSQINNRNKPWSAVVVSDDDITWKQELTGARKNLKIETREK